jgi:S1-C subfamily serine protease
MIRNRRPGRLASAMTLGTVALAIGGCSDSGSGSAPRADAARPVAGIAAKPALAADSPAGAGAEDALVTALERMERRVAGAMARVRDSVVTLEYTAADSPTGARRVAAGVVINPRGEVLSIRIDRPAAATASAGKGARGARSRPGTAADAAPIVARDAAGRRYAAAWVAADPETGLTLLRITPKAVRPVRIATSPPKLGSSVFVVGNPFGLGHSVSRGHVAGLDRALELSARQLGGLTQIQVPLYPGDSGATVANLRGEWLGLIRGGLADSSPTPPPARTARNRDDDLDRDAERDHNHDVGFAIPARDAIWIADQLGSSGRVDRAYLGVRLEPAGSTATTTGVELGDEGARLSEVLADSPAAGAGLRAGDRIVALDAHPIRSPGDLTDRLDRTRAHTKITLGVLRRRDPTGPERDGLGGEAAGLDRIDVSLQAAGRPDPSFPEVESAPTVVRTASTTTADVPTPTSNTAITSAPIRAIASVRRGPMLGAGLPAPTTVATSTPIDKETPTATIPPQRPLPLESQAAPARPPELEPISPRAILERLDRIDRRIDRIEARQKVD